MDETVTRLRSTADRDPVAEIHADVGLLTLSFDHYADYEVWSASRHRVKRRHITHQPALLAQLRGMALTGAGNGATSQGGGGRPHPASRPPGGFEALDRMRAIETGAADWMRVLGLPRRSSPDRALRALVGAATDARHSTGTVRELAADVARWRRWAETITGWKTTPFSPPGPCPQCLRHGGLRVHFEQRTGLCLHCGVTWDAGTIGLLAEHIRVWSELRERRPA